MEALLDPDQMFELVIRGYDFDPKPYCEGDADLVLNDALTNGFAPLMFVPYGEKKAHAALLSEKELRDLADHCIVMAEKIRTGDHP
jgi:hypothetical protein